MCGVGGWGRENKDAATAKNNLAQETTFLIRILDFDMNFDMAQETSFVTQIVDFEMNFDPTLVC